MDIDKTISVKIGDEQSDNLNGENGEGLVNVKLQSSDDVIQVFNP